MTRYFVEVRSISDWQSRLGDPELHWKRGASAMELAVSWTLARHQARGLPEDVAALLDSCETFAGAKVAIAIPELRTRLPGGSTSSQTDLWALLRTDRGTVGLSVEGKALEPFGETVERWMGGQRLDRPPSRGRTERLEFLARRLGMDLPNVGPLRYQLLHRAVASLLEAEHWGADAALMLVQRFAKHHAAPTPSWNDFQAFAARLNTATQPGAVMRAEVPGSMPLYLAWLDCRVARDDELVSVMTDRPARPPAKQNAFEALSRRADNESWCWNLGCTTCGCMHFRYGLIELSQGKHPASSDWITNKRARSALLTRELGSAPHPLPLVSQQEVVRIASRAQVSAIASNAGFPDWLGHLGVVLSFCQEAESETRSLTKAWAPQLAEMLAEVSSLRNRLLNLATGTTSLSLGDLENVEKEIELTRSHNHD
jgi:hypothetical protein